MDIGGFFSVWGLIFKSKYFKRKIFRINASALFFPLCWKVLCCRSVDVTRKRGKCENTAFLPQSAAGGRGVRAEELK